VWAEQAHVFPAWHEYAEQLADRAELAGRSWHDSIKLRHSAHSRAQRPAGGVFARARTWLAARALGGSAAVA
jgi:hypothetical protein